MDMQAENQHLAELDKKVSNLNQYCTDQIHLVRDNCIRLLRQNGKFNLADNAGSVVIDGNLGNNSDDDYGNAKAKQVKK